MFLTVRAFRARSHPLGCSLGWKLDIFVQARRSLAVFVLVSVLSMTSVLCQQVSSDPSGIFVSISQLFPDLSQAFVLDVTSDLCHCEQVLEQQRAGAKL